MEDPKAEAVVAGEVVLETQPQVRMDDDGNISYLNVGYRPVTFPEIWTDDEGTICEVWQCNMSTLPTEEQPEALAVDTARYVIFERTLRTGEPNEDGAVSTYFRWSDPDDAQAFLDLVLRSQIARGGDE